MNKDIGKAQMPSVTTNTLHMSYAISLKTDCTGWSITPTWLHLLDTLYMPTWKLCGSVAVTFWAIFSCNKQTNPRDFSI